ncbi:MAG: hypothetical protein ACRC35_12550, partial [Angustibacter sp.]
APLDDIQPLDPKPADPGSMEPLVPDPLPNPAPPGDDPPGSSPAQCIELPPHEVLRAATIVEQMADILERVRQDVVRSRLDQMPVWELGYLPRSSAVAQTYTASQQRTLDDITTTTGLLREAVPVIRGCVNHSIAQDHDNRHRIQKIAQQIQSSSA